MTSAIITGGSGFIGSNLSVSLKASGCHFTNYDKNPPACIDFIDNWHKLNLLDSDSLLTSLAKHRPDTIYHLAAETRIDGTDNDFICNVTTTKNVLDAAALIGVRRVIVASTMLVHPLGTQPRDELPGIATTAYGRSKATMERMVRLHPWHNWTIVRPTTIWGPWHRRLADEFISRLSRGAYFHPNAKCFRSYGYVENVCSQLQRIAYNDSTVGSVLFVGDTPIPLAVYVDAFNIALRGRKAKRAPLWGLNAVAKMGDVLRWMNLPFPLTSYRLSNMTQDNVIDMSRTLMITGAGPFGLEDGVARTVSWWRKHPS